NADKTFHQADTPVCPFEASSVLVTYGLYRFTRNPMYLGFVLILFGAFILLGSLTPFVIALAFVFLMDRMFIRMEEQKLAATFGAQWEEYKSRTRRWL
ncbi:MAG TPA: isoprenylcysteine carboxylmethyltransferase family protein, partial [Anaerolineales bacterium]|nr:isoprenylcysteine carboxylmethyltransferase family protein [Anaerolineales bacterium]